MKKLFYKRFEHYSHEPVSPVHSTRLKESILLNIPELEETKTGREVILAFRQDGMCLARAVSILRKAMFEDFPDFDGCFSKENKTASVPKSLLAFIQMILEGGNIEIDNNDSAVNVSEASLSIAQLIRFNSLRRTRSSAAKYQRYPREQETPLPIYNGLMLYTRIRKKSLISSIATLGLSIPYDRVQSIQTSIAQNICEQFQRINSVVPLTLMQDKFMLSAIDNLDLNAKSATAKTHFHGTAISIFQFKDTSVKAVKRRGIDGVKTEQNRVKK